MLKGNSLKYILTIVAAFLLLLLATSCVSEQVADNEWDILMRKAVSLNQQAQYDSAVVVTRKAIEVAKKNVGADHPNVATSLNYLASLYHDQGQYAQAEPLYKRALAIRESALDPNHPDVALSLENLALLYRATKRDKEAEELELRAATIRSIKR